MAKSNISIVIRTSGLIEAVSPNDTKRGWTLDELYGHMGCEMIEIVQPNTKSNVIEGNWKNPIMICDEEGILNGKQINVLASFLAGQHIVGDVVITESKNLR